MTNVRSHWLLVATMALMTFLAMLGWGAYAYSSSLSATLSKQRGERDGAIAKLPQIARLLLQRSSNCSWNNND